MPMLTTVMLATAAEPDFENEVAPILEMRCLSCHDASNSKGDVRLDLREFALKAISPGKHLITLGKPDDSMLIESISGSNPDMPKKAEPLTAKQVQTLRDWITAGAPWPEQRILKNKSPRNTDWWSLQPIKLVKPPSKGHPIDAFLDAKLVEMKLRPNQQADNGTLIRRLTFDLTGLPPTKQQIDEFKNVRYEQFVDTLLASPTYGEKFAQHWLDVARYAETHGYDKDKPRTNAWPYRDYVIRSFNDDKPYDRFVQEQIAGDALFPGTPDGVIGLGFLAAGPWDYIGHSEVGEGKIDGRIAKHLDRDDMVAAVGNVFISTTVQCAQCHIHKFDPIVMEDYYRLHAVFSAVDRADRVYPSLSIEQEKHRDSLLSKLNKLKTEGKNLEDDIVHKTKSSTSDKKQRVAELDQSAKALLQPPYGWHSGISSKQNEIKWIQLDLGSTKSVSHLRIIAAYDKSDNNIGAGFGFPVRYKIESADNATFTQGIRLLRDSTDFDQEAPKNQNVIVTVSGDPVRFIRITATKLAARDKEFFFALGEVEVIGSENYDNLALGVMASSLDNTDYLTRWSIKNLTDGIYYGALENPQMNTERRNLLLEIATIEDAVRTPTIAKKEREIRQGIDNINQQLSLIPRGDLVYAATTNFKSQGKFIQTGGKPRPINLLKRGDINTPGAAMRPGMMPLWPGAKDEFELAPNAPETESRAALARAISAHTNPLLWRSMANRLWQWTYGQPLVKTPNDFGRMGMKPTHPELLDWLAATLRDDPKHSLKSIIRLLVTSAAYRRASIHDDTNMAIDAGNECLWRGQRRRLTAEEFRDSVLAASGKFRLDDRGGPSFYDFIIDKPQHSPHYQYHLHNSDDPKSFRRSIYRFVVRSQPQPLLTALDCADPSSSVPIREESTTALQALTQWNNPFIETMSRHFGTRIDAVPSHEQIAFACLIAFGRSPHQYESNELSAYQKIYGSASLARVLFNLSAFNYVE